MRPWPARNATENVNGADPHSRSVLRTIAYQIGKSLDETDNPASQNVSLELCIRGFAVFQNSFDAVRVLRSIFHLATSTSTLPALVNLRNLARQAVLSIAAINAPLFMTVLSFDAVQADADSEERAKTMKLIAFMVRKVCVLPICASEAEGVLSLGSRLTETDCPVC